MLEHLFMTQTNWTAMVNIAKCSRARVYDVANGNKTSSRISALLPTLTVKKLDWRVVADFVSKNTNRPRPYKSRYVYEVAKGFRKNAQLFRLLEGLHVIEMLERQEREQAEFRQANREAV
jgi:hypothetical protein